MVAVCRDQLSGVALVPTGTKICISTVIEKGIPGVMEVPSVNRGGLVVVARYLHLVMCHPPASKVLHSQRAVGRSHPIY